MIRARTLLLVSSLATFPAAAAERVLTLDPQATTISFHLKATGHDVEGAFELVAGELRFDPETGAADGEIRIDATRAKTGNQKRDKKMHGEVLETGPYPVFLFHARHIEGPWNDHGSSDVQLQGDVSIHGAEHPLTLPAKVTVEGDRITATTEFPIPFVEWGMEDPSWFVLKVAKLVDVTVKTEGRLSGEPEAHAAGGR